MGAREWSNKKKQPFGASIKGTSNAVEDRDDADVHVMMLIATMIISVILVMLMGSKSS